MNTVNYPIQTYDELQENMPAIEEAIVKQTDNPAIPIITTLNLEMELSMLQNEHLIENDSLESFEGLTEEHVLLTILSTRVNNTLIADVDGRGPIDHPRPPATENNENLEPIIKYILEKDRKAA